LSGKQEIVYALNTHQEMTKPPPNSIHPKTRAGWRKWLEQHHTQAEGVWLISFKKAKQYFEAFPRSVKRGILEWIASAKKPETRAKRIEETARLAAQNVRANQWRQ
jgi:uncharacterized protein YdeI (YjbR/CyaY-like superfamily)